MLTLKEMKKKYLKNDVVCAPVCFAPNNEFYIFIIAIYFKNIYHNILFKLSDKCYDGISISTLDESILLPSAESTYWHTRNIYSKYHSNIILFNNL